MKLISIIRHAKTEVFNVYGDDFERALTNRGEKDAARIAKRLAKLEPPVDFWLSSPALRASQTTTLMTEAIEYSGTIHWEQSIYMAAASWAIILAWKCSFLGYAQAHPCDSPSPCPQVRWPMWSWISIAGNRFAGIVACYTYY